jgi:hypothetical protein
MFKPKPGTIVTATALVIAVFGSTPLGHAAGNLILPKNSVGVAQLKSNAVTGLKVKDGTLKAAGFTPGELPAGAVSPAGPQGSKGDKGTRATPAPRASAGTRSRRGNTVTIAPDVICANG